jgi:hypothetical protein
MKLLIKYATRKRPALFLKAMDNILSTVTGDFRIIVSIDSDDSEMIKLVSERSFANTQVFINDNFGGKIGAINANIPLSGWDWLVNTSDDMHFLVKGWDQIMIEQIRKVWGNSLDFFANFNDGFQGPKLATMSVMGREYYERFFYIYAPCYRSLSCDAEAFYVAQALGRYHYFPELLYKHMHPANVKGVKSDQLYIQNEVYAKQDAKIYFDRLNKNFYINNPGVTPFDRYKGRR